MGNVPQQIYIKNANVFLENDCLHGSILMENGRIKEILDKSRMPASLISDACIIDAKQLNVIPGFIDGHIHGAAGSDVMDATETAIDTIASILPKEGTTSFVATTITQAPENIDEALKNMADYQHKPGQAEVLGIHLEGPFINKNKAGAQPPEYIMEPDVEQFGKWQRLSGNKIKTITLAPEKDKDGSFIRYLHQSGVNVSAGHTASDFATMKKAVAQGVRQVTHVCNAMSGIHHRDIGVVGAAFQLHNLRAELIADGIHVSPEMLQLIYNNMGSERLILITDAMRAKCLQAGYYELGGQPVTVINNRAELEDGTLAGSMLKMNHGARNMLALNGATLFSVVEMASVNPARQLRVYDRKGSIAVGKDADVLIVDDALNIKYAICRGRIAYEEE